MSDQNDYTYRKPSGENYYSGMNNNNMNNNDLGAWIAIVITLVVFPPVGIVLLFRKLMGYSDRGEHRKYRKMYRQKYRTTGTHPYDLRQEQSAHQYWANQAAQTGQKSQAWSQKQQNPGAASYTPPKQSGNAGQKSGYRPPSHMNAKVSSFKKIPTGRGLIIGGSITAGIFGLGFMTTLLDSIRWGGLTADLAGLFALLSFFSTGLVLLYAGLSRGRKGKRFRKYLAVIGNRDLISVSELSQKTGIGEKKVRDDLQSMLDMGLFPQGYLDLSVDMLVLSDNVSVTREESKTETAAAAADAIKDEDKALFEIRQVNDEIADEEMSRKIDRIEEITAKILDYQRKNPGKNSQLRSFLNYYLPTTLKILRAYAQLEAQGIEGQNISSAKVRIEGMMDKVVEGFEKQLDMLFQNDAMDITTDVSVLEQMLKKDGLSGGQGMTLGG